MDNIFEEEHAQQSSFDPFELVRRCWRRRWLFVVPFILCLSMAWVAIKVMTPIYYSSGQIRVIFDAPSSRLLNDQMPRYSRSRDLDREAMITINTIVTAPKFLAAVVREHGLHRDAVGLQAKAPGNSELLPSVAEQDAIRKAAKRLSNWIRVQTDGAHVFSVGVRNTDPELSYALARTVLDRFLEEERNSRLARRSSTRDFMEEQRKNAIERVAGAEVELTGFQRSMLTATMLGNPINYQNLTRAEEAQVALRQRFDAEDAAEMAVLEGEARRILNSLPRLNTFTRDQEIVPVVRDILDLEFEDLTGSSTRGGISADTQNQLGRFRIRLNTLVESRIVLQYPRLGVMDRNRVTRYVYFLIYRDIQRQVIDRLARNINEFRDFTARQPEQSARLNMLQDELRQARELLDSIEREITQQTMNLEASESQIGYRIEVRRDPELPTFPIEPNKVKLGFMGFVLSLGMGAGLVVLSILLDRSFTSVPEIEKTLGLKVIGTLPVIRDEHFERKRRLQILRWITIVVVILGVAAVGLFVVYPKLS